MAVIVAVGVNKINIMCQQRKCLTPTCTVTMQACQLIQGYCVTCWNNKQKQNNNVPNTTTFIQSPINNIRT